LIQRGLGLLNVRIFFQRSRERFVEGEATQRRKINEREG
jgi:hypothetical protein